MTYCNEIAGLLGDERKTFRSPQRRKENFPFASEAKGKLSVRLRGERKTFPSSPIAIPFVLVILELSQALKIGE